MAHDATLIAYLAGLFDGEGCARMQQGVWCMEVSMTNQELVELFHSTFAVGSINLKRNVSALSNKPQWRWRVYGEAAWSVYYAMRPYLREKIWKGEPN